MECGGSGFFVSSSLRFNERKDLSKAFRDNLCEFDAFWIEIENCNSPKVLIAAIYNHPRKNSTKFIQYLETVLKKISKENKLYVITGDFNLDLLRYDKIPDAENFIDTMFSNFLQPLILQPTRYTSSKKNHHSSTISLSIQLTLLPQVETSFLKSLIICQTSYSLKRN